MGNPVTFEERLEDFLQKSASQPVNTGISASLKVDTLNNSANAVASSQPRKHFVTAEPPPKTPTTASHMSIGQYALVVDGPSSGHTIVRTYTGWVSLNDPMDVWRTAPASEVVIHPVGMRITITVR